MDHDGREGVEKEGGEFVQTVEHQTVLPDDDGTHERAHAQDIVGLTRIGRTDLILDLFPHLKPIDVIQIKCSLKEH